MKQIALILSLLLFANCEQEQITDNNMEYQCYTLVYHYDVIDTRNGNVIRAGEVQTVKYKAYSEAEITSQMQPPKVVSDTSELRGYVVSLTASDLSNCP